MCGVPLPDGLVDGSRLPEPIFTPATKAAFGEHDENVDFETMVATTGRELGEQLRDLTLAVYARAEEVARGRGLILADTKLEFGRRADGTLVLGDEVLTPDSSRYWDAATWEPGARLDAFDKQFIRDWLLQDSGWDRGSGDAPPSIPGAVVTATRERYLQAYERLTGSAFVSS
ncbi:phosphoribosylaminoimidazole-succinocarboxamide synthase [Friedmanniella antarctica]|uniref:phosphoribosylaminoimidazolesuccinocarboxamide synthase n=1 Tax=Microlunatus antarcticus TaxID=53388 RepID=A0A7W5P9L0_9ACTN|nr:phosphoribosylaminoimidazole-succinocarboxamide synthase [Microlunatus antarcticus]